MYERQDLSVPVIAIDGGAGTGKGTARAEVARRFQWHGLDSGLLYRAVGMKSANLPGASAAEIAEVAQALDLRMDGQTVYLDGVDVTREIRSDRAGKLASEVSPLPEVRHALLMFQLNMRKSPGLVTDGRDQGYIFDTPHRFFFETDPEERARRRMRQFESLGVPADHDSILEEIHRRDHADATRTVSPLRPHPEALVIDTTRLSIGEVVTKVVTAFYYGFKAVA